MEDQIENHYDNDHDNDQEVVTILYNENIIEIVEIEVEMEDNNPIETTTEVVNVHKIKVDIVPTNETNVEVENQPVEDVAYVQIVDLEIVNDNVPNINTSEKVVDTYNDHEDDSNEVKEKIVNDTEDIENNVVDVNDNVENH